MCRYVSVFMLVCAGLVLDLSVRITWNGCYRHNPWCVMMSLPVSWLCCCCRSAPAWAPQAPCQHTCCSRPQCRASGLVLVQHTTWHVIHKQNIQQHLRSADKRPGLVSTTPSAPAWTWRHECFGFVCCQTNLHLCQPQYQSNTAEHPVFGAAVSCCVFKWARLCSVVCVSTTIFYSVVSFFHAQRSQINVLQANPPDHICFWLILADPGHSSSPDTHTPADLVSNNQ